MFGSEVKEEVGDEVCRSEEEQVNDNSYDFERMKTDG